MSCPSAVWTTTKAFFTTIIPFTFLTYRKTHSITCDDDDCCGLVENHPRCSPACSSIERCKVQFPADRWITPMRWGVTIIRCTSLNSLSPPFPLVLHSFSLLTFRDKLFHEASNKSCQNYVIQRMSTAFAIPPGASSGNQGARQHVYNSHHRG